jgi:peroxiredoxin
MKKNQPFVHTIGPLVHFSFWIYPQAPLCSPITSNCLMKRTLFFLKLTLCLLLQGAAQDSLRLYFFLSEDCPICRSYADEMHQLFDDYHEQGIAFRGVFPVVTSSKASILQFQESYAIPFPLLKDVNQHLTQKFDARVTPEVCLLRGDRILYRGRIDNRFDRPGRQRRHVTQHELRDALEAGLAGKPVKVPETQPVGCFITLSQ